MSVGTSRRVVFWLQVAYLLVLLVIPVLTLWRGWPLPQNIGPTPIGVPWFGALGAVLISLTGVLEHVSDWNPDYAYWHWSRPLAGAALSVVAVLVFQAGILAVGSNPAPSNELTKNLLYYVVAFLVGYREETFRELIKRVTDVVLAPAPTPAAPVVTRMSPNAGPAAGSTTVTIAGSGLAGATGVRFGATDARFRAVSDGELDVTTPPGSAGVVSVVVVAKGGSAVAGQYTYQ